MRKPRVRDNRYITDHLAVSDGEMLILSWVNKITKADIANCGPDLACLAYSAYKQPKVIYYI